MKFLGKGLGTKYAKLAKAAKPKLLEAMRSVAEDVKEDFEKTVETWDTKPEFNIREVRFRWSVYTDDQIYAYVDRGTKPHTIRPKRPGYPLAFQSGYVAKTIPRVIASRPGGASGPMVFTYEVHHPGTEAREFTATIYEKWNPLIPERVDEMLKELLEEADL